MMFGALGLGITPAGWTIHRPIKVCGQSLDWLVGMLLLLLSPSRGNVGSAVAASWMHYSGYLQLAAVPYGCRLYILAAGCLIGLTEAVLKLD